MEDWQRDFLAMVETVTDSCEQFFQDFTEAVEAVAEEVSEAIDAATEHWQNTILAEMDQHWYDLFEPIIDEYIPIEEIVDETEFSSGPKIEPTLKENPACINCRHYHGRIYGGNLFVCAMHPYGWDDEHCPDWN